MITQFIRVHKGNCREHMTNDKRKAKKTPTRVLYWKFIKLPFHQPFHRRHHLQYQSHLHPHYHLMN